MPESITQRLNRGVSRRELSATLLSVQSDLASLTTQFNKLRTDYAAHVHGGVTAGAANTAATGAPTAAAVTLNTQP